MTQRLERNIWRYSVFQALWITAFFVPIVVLFWEENGLDAFDIYLLQGLYAVAVVILEVPTGMVADQIGKRTSLILGTAILVVGFVIYAIGASFLLFLVAEIVTALGMSLISGADSALLYDTLATLDRKSEFRELEGRARAIQMVAFAAACVVGGFVGEYSFRATLWLTVAGSLAGLVVAFTLVEAIPVARRNGTAGGEPPRTYGHLLRDSLLFLRKHRLVRWYVLFLAVLSGSSTWLLWLYQPYMQWTGLPIYAFGIAFAIFNLFAAFASRVAHRFDDRLGRRGALLGMGLLQIAPMILMAWIITPLSFLFILCHQAVRGISRVIISDRILRYTYADKRATILSMGALSGRLFFAVTAPWVGWVAKVEPMPARLLFQAGLLAAFLLLLLLWYRRIPAKYFVVKESVQQRV